ncbi:hypothetical protein BDR05DRAFT_228916 [Suillus weaverae]|nr:hypothetical protein BDR05DRAFT_228916 [Suillus weaverae]
MTNLHPQCVLRAWLKKITCSAQESGSTHLIFYIQLTSKFILTFHVRTFKCKLGNSLPYTLG